MSATEIVLSFLNAMILRDFDAAVDLVSEDIVYDNKPLATLRGRRKFDQFLRPWVESNDEISILIHTVAEVGETVVVERTDRHRLAEGEWHTTQAAGFYRVRGGKICEWRDYFDLMPFCAQTGQRYEDIVQQAGALSDAP